MLGNGINSRLCIWDLSVKNIADRFKKNVLVYSIIINNIFGVQIEEDFLNYSEMPISELGIETLAGVLYKYIKENKNQSWTDNDEYRLQDLITCICITSIFYDKKGKIGQVYDKSKMPFVENYDIIHFLRREMLDFTAFPVFFVSNLLLVQRKKYYFNRAMVSRNCSIVL